MLNRQKQAVDDAWQQYCNDVQALQQTQRSWHAACPRQLQPVMPLLLPFLAGVLFPLLATHYRRTATLSSALLNTTKVLTKAIPLVDRIQRRTR